MTVPQTIRETFLGALALVMVLGFLMALVLLVATVGPILLLPFRAMVEGILELTADGALFPAVVVCAFLVVSFAVGRYLTRDPEKGGNADR